MKPEKDTEIIDKLFLELSQFTQARTNNDKMYYELLFAVKTKYPDESRHQTALRYIMEAGSDSNKASQSEVK
jgi:hypothetical protein